MKKATNLKRLKNIVEVKTLEKEVSKEEKKFQIDIFVLEHAISRKFIPAK